MSGHDSATPLFTQVPGFVTVRTSGSGPRGFHPSGGRGVSLGMTMIDQNRLDALRLAGVTLVDPSTTFIDDGVAVGPGTVIHPGVTLEGRTRVGAPQGKASPAARPPLTAPRRRVSSADHGTEGPAFRYR